MLFDLGSHLIDQALCSSARPRACMRRWTAPRPAPRSTTTCSSRSSMPGGVRAHLWASTVAAQPGPRFRRSVRAPPTSSTASTCRRRRCAPASGRKRRASGASRASAGVCSAPRREPSRSQTDPGRYLAFYQRMVAGDPHRGAAAGAARMRSRAGDDRGGAGSAERGEVVESVGIRVPRSRAGKSGAMNLHRAARRSFAALLAPPSQRSAPTRPDRRPARPRRPGQGGDLGGGDKDGFGTSRTAKSKVWYTLNDGAPDRGLLPADRHAGDPGHPARRDRRRHLRRPRGRGHRPPGGAASTRAARCTGRSTRPSPASTGSPRPT